MRACVCFLYTCRRLIDLSNDFACVRPLSGCEVTPIKGGVEHSHGKVNVLLQSYLNGSRAYSGQYYKIMQHIFNVIMGLNFVYILSGVGIKAFSLVIDQMYIAREAGRLLRALFEMTFYSLARYVVDAVCFVYTCRRLIDLSNDCRATNEPYKGWVDTAMSILAICKALERRCWHTRHPLTQLAGQPGITPDVLQRLDSHAGWLEIEALRDMTAQQLEAHFTTGGKANRQLRVPELLRTVAFLPKLRIDTELRPITRVQTAHEGEAVVVRVDAFVSADFTWSGRSNSESWLVYVQDDKQRLVHFESITLRKPDKGSSADLGSAEQQLRFHLQISDPCPPAFFLFAESESWVGVHTVAEIDFDDLVLPRSSGAHTVIPPQATLLPVASLGDIQLEAVLTAGGVGLTNSNASGSGGGGGECFNQVVSTVFEPLYKTDRNLLIAAAAGNGHSACAELAIARALGSASGAAAGDSDSGGGGGGGGGKVRPQVLYLAVKGATVGMRSADWHERFSGLLGYTVGVLSDRDGDTKHNHAVLNDADVICASASQWERIVRETPASESCTPPRLGLLIVDELHLLGDGGAGDAAGDGGLMELALSRWLPAAAAAAAAGSSSSGGAESSTTAFRVVGLAGAALATDSASDLSSWLGVSVEDLGSGTHCFNFSNGVRPTPQELIVKKFEEKRHTPRLTSMNKPVFQALTDQKERSNSAVGKAAVVFVSSRSQCWLTAIDLIALATASSGGVSQFTGEGNGAVLEGRLRAQRTSTSMRHTLRWGVGLYYSGMDRKERQLVTSLWEDGLLHVLIATPDMCYGTNERDFSAPLVIIKGTERYNGAKGCFEAYRQSAVLQMIGR